MKIFPSFAVLMMVMEITDMPVTCPYHFFSLAVVVKRHHNSKRVSEKDRKQSVERQIVRERPYEVKLTRGLFAEKLEVK